MQEWQGQMYLNSICDDDLEAPDDHHLGGGYPAHSLGHQHATYNSQECLLRAENPGGGCPVTEERVHVDTKHADGGDDETTCGKPEHQHGVVDMASLARDDTGIIRVHFKDLELPSDDGNPSRGDGHGDGKTKPHHVIGFFHDCITIIRGHVLRLWQGFCGEEGRWS